MKQVTLEDVAARVGISKYSVSRALSGKPGVSKGTRLAVITAARAMGYQHRALAPQGLAVENSNIVLLIPHQDIADIEFWMGVINGASEEAEQLGYTFITRPFTEANSQRPTPLENVHGLIVAGSRARIAMQPYLDAGVPASLVTYPQPLEPFDAVYSADVEGGYAVGEHLIKLGHRRLAFVTEAPEKPSFAARARGLREAARAQGVQVEEIHIDPDEPGTSFEAACRTAGDLPFSAVLASTDGIAFTVIWTLNRLGLNVPDDISVVGYNDTAQASRFVPKLTTLRIPTREIGAMAMRFLHERITGTHAAYPPRRLVFAQELVLRESTAPYKAAKVASEGNALRR
jgi:LacI family transcriptional regulator